MAVLTPGAMKNKISFYRESLAVNNAGEKVKTVSIIKRDVGAEFKYIGTPSAGASEERIQEQRTGKIKAEIRCRYFKGVKFEDVVYFEGGKFRIYSIQYEGRHEVLKIRAELRDDDTYFGLPDQEYPFIAAYDSDHTRTSASYQVIENAPFPKQTSTTYIFDAAGDGVNLNIDIGDGEANGRESEAMTSDKTQFPYNITGDLTVPADGKIRGYTSAWYNMHPNNANPYARVEVDGEVLFESSSSVDVLLPAGTGSPTHEDANGNKFYKVSTADWTDVDQALYTKHFGDLKGFLFYRMTPIGPETDYLSTLNGRDSENSVTRVAGGSVYAEYAHPITLNNLSLSFPTDIDERILRQQGQLMGQVAVASQNSLTTVDATNKLKTGNVKITDGAGGLRISVINSVTIKDENGVAVTVDSEDTALLDRFELTADSAAAGIAFVDGESIDAEWAGGEITFNVDFSPSSTTGSHSENTSNAAGVDLTYKLV